jgi:hypothetical protein
MQDFLHPGRGTRQALSCLDLPETLVKRNRIQILRGIGWGCVGFLELIANKWASF